MKYKTLAQRNPDYDADVWQELGDLYEGGYAIQRHASHYMPKMIGEMPDRYQERLRVAGYVCYFGQIVDYFAADLFSQEITVTPAADLDAPRTEATVKAPADEPFYDTFADDVDLRGTPFAKLLREVFTTAIVKGKGLIAIDFPDTDPEVKPSNRAEEDAAGAARAYAFEIPVEQLIDWETDDRGRLMFAVLHRVISRRESPAASRDSRFEEFKVWTRDDSGAVSWQLYRTEPYRPEKPPHDNDEIPLVGEGSTSFDRIPIIELTIPRGLWVGNKIGPVAKEHYQRRNLLTAAENKSLFAIPYVKLGSEMGAAGAPIPSEAQQNPNRGDDPRLALANKGYLVIGSDDDVGFAEPGGSAYKLVDDQLTNLVEEMFRVVHQMAASVSNSSASLGRSGDSKAEDRHATAIVLAAYGALVRDVSKRVYDVVSAARGETVEWAPHGLDNFDGDDRAALLAEAIQLDAVAIPSLTFKRLYKTHVALRLVPNIQPDVAETIRQEIEDGVETEQARSDAMADLAMLATSDPNAPEGPDGEPASAPPGRPPRRAPRGPRRAPRSPGER
jgi:hypothetical protein